jgi:N-methylhydantoinase A/oxoprolinase/acetone carboxylase beta subunit
MQNYIIGIDTGGTFTDGVMLNRISGDIVTSVKKPTTHYQLALGIGATLAELLAKSAIDPNEIATVALSSTLATNSVVENKGARVAVFVIGYVKHFKLPVTAVVYVKGGHNLHGEEEEPLELEYVVELLEGLRKEVDAYGVCSAMSIKNPTHELVVEKAITMIDPKPVFCSHRASQQTGMRERAATAALHAKLMPIMETFITGVQEAMIQCRLSCPLTIIGGNGKCLPADQVISEAGLTVASGPACTAHFGSIQQFSNCLVVDVGGTTTDIALVENGRLLLATDGCAIGRWRTHVEAVDMFTGGIGGDSHCHIDHTGKLTIGPNRVVPLSLVEDIPPVAAWLGSDRRSRLICLEPGAQHELGHSDLEILLMQEQRLTPEKIRRATGLGGIPLDRQLEQLGRRQLIFECGFTPTDALHVLGLLELGNAARAAAAAKILGKSLGMEAEEFSARVIHETEDTIATLVIDYLVKHFWDDSLTGFLSSRHNHPVVQVDFAIKLPIIGLGAAARYFLPKVAEKLHTTVHFPANCEVGNAIGAALIGAAQTIETRVNG